MSKPFFTIHNVAQQTEEWFRIRIGRPTASCFDKIITPGGEPSKQSKDYSRLLVAECIIPDYIPRDAGSLSAAMLSKLITDKGADSSKWDEIANILIAEEIRPDQSASFDGNYDTDRGNELEAEARDEFAEEMSFDVRQVGFVTRDDNMVGCSPDGLIYHDGEPVAGLELKCPRAKAHVEYSTAGILPSKYAPQVHGSLAVTGLDHWYFRSHCRGMRPFTFKVMRDAYTDKVYIAVYEFLKRYRDEWPDTKDKLLSAKERFEVYYKERKEVVIPILLGKEAA